MSVKMIAVDMDGTFLNSQQRYDQARFLALFRKMQSLDVHFVVASGNQYAQLISFFPEIKGEISYVAENGAYIEAEGQKLFAASIPPAVLAKTVALLAEHPRIHGLLCGEKTAYCAADIDQTFYDYASKYYIALEKVPDLLAVEDNFLKFALSCPLEEVSASMAFLEENLAGALVPVSSGHGDIDLILPGVHKAAGIEQLQKHFGISRMEVAAFGDSGNDLEMIQHAHYSYAMANGAENVKQAAKVVLRDNDSPDVLDTIAALLGEIETANSNKK